MHGVQIEGTKLLHGGCKNTDNFLYRIYYIYIRLIKLKIVRLRWKQRILLNEFAATRMLRERYWYLLIRSKFIARYRFIYFSW